MFECNGFDDPTPLVKTAAANATARGGDAGDVASLISRTSASHIW